jgi:YD repeat-containing protein
MPFEHQDVKKFKCMCGLLHPAGDLHSGGTTTSYTYDLASNRKSVKPTDDQIVTYDSEVYMNR